ncbi:MAG TPA: hypothetical protein PKA63_02515 [Oligoflexia bacterium]|nr:hypothetical protein [Oligoflexia bacterium]HMP47525.1 hypothetical protein [Oligoflexia bacterium]
MKKLIILGASNVTFSLPLICRIISASSKSLADPDPFHLLVAAGHGRSYCGASKVLGRTLPSLINCRIWKKSRKLHNSYPETRSLITDIGNDLLYGYSPEKIIASVSVCIDRLLEHGDSSRVLLSLLPLESLSKMSPLQYHIARSILFPFRKHESIVSIMEKVNELQEGLLLLEKKFKILTLTPPSTWYGIDPIHIKWSKRKVAWLEMLTQNEELLPEESLSLSNSIKVYLQKPERRKILCIDQYTKQPCYSFGDVCKLYLF